MLSSLGVMYSVRLVKMLVEGVVLLCYLTLSLVEEAGCQTECCPMAEQTDQLMLQPGVHVPICLNYRYFRLGSEQYAALFNATGGSCSNGYPLPNLQCSVYSVSITNSNCMHGAAVVRCWLKPEAMVIPPASTPPDDGDDISDGGDGSDEGEDGGDVREGEVVRLGLVIGLESTDSRFTGGISSCNLLLQNITWKNTEYCNIEESHSALTDGCSGVGRIVTGVATNTSLFIVENKHISEVGESALLIGESTPFCGEYSFNATTLGEGLICQVENDSGLNIGAVENLNSSKSYLVFRCTGDWSSVDAGRARIVFQRNLSSAMDSQCQSVSVARPYYSQWASIPVHWTHGESNLCEQVSDLNLNECLKMCTEDAASNVALCVSLVELILDRDQLSDSDLLAVLTVLSGLNNASTVASLDRAIYLIDRLSITADRVNFTWSLNGQKMFISVIDEVLDNRSTWELLQERQGREGGSPASSVLLERMERFLEMVGRNSIDNVLNFSGMHIKSLQVETITPQALSAGYFTMNFQQGAGDVAQNFLLIPEQLLCAEHSDYSDGKDCSSTIATALVYSLPLYLDQVSSRHPSLFVNSPLLMLSVPNQANTEFPIQDYPIQLRLTPVYPNATGVSRHSCMYWDFNIRDWSAEGVTTSVAADGSYICTTTHLTSFAVLVGLTMPSNNNDTSVEEKALRVITYIGSGISLLCLVLSLLVFITCGKRLNKGVLLYIHFNFCLSLCLALLVFIAGIESAVSIVILCKVIAIILHYFFLCAFCWMLAEGIMLYILVVKVFGKLATRWYYLLLLGWGLPVPIVAISVGIQHDLYGTSHFCWLSTEGGMIWAFVGPMLFIVCINSVFLVLTVGSLLRSRKYGGAERSVSGLQLVRSAVKSTLILLPLLGLTWVLGIFAVNEDTVVFAWLFTVCNSLQGFLFFVLHVLRNKKVSSVIQQAVCCSSLSASKLRRPSANDVSSKFNTTFGSSSYAVNRVGVSYNKVSESRHRALLMERSFSQTSTESTTSTTLDFSSSV